MKPFQKIAKSRIGFLFGVGQALQLIVIDFTPFTSMKRAISFT